MWVAFTISPSERGIIELYPRVQTVLDSRFYRKPFRIRILNNRKPLSRNRAKRCSELSRIQVACKPRPLELKIINRRDWVGVLLLIMFYLFSCIRKTLIYQYLCVILRNHQFHHATNGSLHIRWLLAKAHDMYDLCIYVVHIFVNHGMHTYTWLSIWHGLTSQASNI